MINKEELREIANDNIGILLDELGIDYCDRGDYLNGRCPIHGGDNASAFSWSIRLNRWKCFTKGCQEKYGKDIIGLVMAVKRLSVTDAIRYIIEKLDIDPTKIKASEEASYERKIVRSYKMKKQGDIDEGSLKNLSRPNELIERGFSADLLKEYGIGNCERGWLGGIEKSKKWSGFFKPRTIIPVINEDNNLVGWVGRKIFKDDDPKWLPNPGFKRSNNLFNINRSKGHIKRSTKVILCEGPLDVIRLVQNNILNAVAIFGVSISQEQIRLLMKHGAFTAYVALDHDDTGVEKSEKICSQISNLFTVHNLTNKLPRGKDIGELSLEEITQIFLDKK